MLKELVMSLDTQTFKKCGLFPINREQVMERIPDAVQMEITQHVDKVRRIVYFFVCPYYVL
jgi:hypothetical protein